MTQPEKGQRLVGGWQPLNGNINIGVSGSRKLWSHKKEIPSICRTDSKNEMKGAGNTFHSNSEPDAPRLEIYHLRILIRFYFKKSFFYIQKSDITLLDLEVWREGRVKFLRRHKKEIYLLNAT